MSKTIKKMLALVIAMVMIVGTMNMAAFAAVGDRKVNSPISVQNLEDGDQVKYYKVIEWEDQKGWKLTDTYKAGLGDDADDILARILAGAISAADADKIAGVTATAETDADAAISNGTWTSGAVEAGLYMVAIAAGKSGTVYNPVFVAANWYNEGSTPDSANVIPMSEDMGYGDSTYSDTAMAKKKVITVDKTTNGSDGTTGQKTGTGDVQNAAYTTDKGEVVSFTIETTIPLYADNYTKPQFKVSDTLTGLAIVGSITVTSGNVTYTIDPTETDGKTSFVITFDSAKIKALTTAQDVVITYNAKVTDEADYVINQDDNTVKVNYSNAPDDEEGHGVLKDKTNHFTFSIDASVFGDDSKTSTEVIKIGVDKDGNPVESEVTYEDSESTETHAALNGAKFKLYTDAACEHEYEQNGTAYGEITTDNKGRLEIKGLDAGNYWLKETAAPAGYIAYDKAVPVVITAEIQEEEVTEMEGDMEVTYTTNKLVSYTITVGGGSTTYEIQNSKAVVTEASRSADSSDGEIVDTKGVELPSTGGMGTTLFYIIGAVLVLGAGILLVTRRRMSAN